MTRVLVALVCAAGIQPALSAPGSASPGTARCAGRVPTIASDARTVTGTPGDDVIVALGKRVDVEAGAGDDTICVRGRNGYVTVDAGGGRDDVRVEAHTSTVVDLSTGRNEFRGGTGIDRVVSGAPGQRNRDRIRLGAGDDSVFLRGGRDHRRAVLLGGAGDDELSFSPRRRGALTVDAATRRATLAGTAYATWDGFEAFEVMADGRQTFVGTDGDDDVEFAGEGPVSATTLGGDDRVTLQVRSSLTPVVHMPLRVTARAASSDAIELDLGLGTDLLDVVSNESRVVGDLALQRMDLLANTSSGVEPVGAFGFAGVDGLVVHVPGGATREDPTAVTLTGDEHDNVLRADACHVELHGGAGDDSLRVGDNPEALRSETITGPQRNLCGRTSDLYGDGGDDLMVSHVFHYDMRGVGIGVPVRATEVPVRDHLDGGEGTDTARAGSGTDTCLAETRVACEA